MKVKFTMNMGLAGCRREETVEFEDPMTDEDLDQCLQEWAANFVELNWKQIE